MFDFIFVSHDLYFQKFFLIIKGKKGSWILTSKAIHCPPLSEGAAIAKCDRVSGFRNKRSVFFMVLEAGESKFKADWVPAEGAFFLFHRWQLLAMSSHGRYHSHRLCLYDPITSCKAPSPHITTLWDRISVCPFWENTNIETIIFTISLSLCTY